MIGKSARGGLLAVAIALASVDAAFAKLPDWARLVADSASPAPEGVPKEDSRVLLTEVRYEVRSDGSMRIRKRFAAQALTSQGSEFQVGSFAFPGTTKVTSSRAWHLPPDAKARRSWSTPVDIALGNSFLDDSKLRLLAVNNAAKGSLVFFEFEAVDKPYFLGIAHFFHEGAGIDRGRLEVETPPGWQVQWAWLRTAGMEPLVTGDVRVWEVKDVPSPIVEPLALSDIDRAPLLVVQMVPPPGVTVAPAVLPTWPAFSEYYDDMLRRVERDSPQVQAAASRSLAGKDFFENVRSTGNFVRDKVRYVAVELGIGGWQPRPPGETLANLYGDCKDKGTLFRAMLATGGIRSWPVLVNLTIQDTVAENVAVSGFNHFVLAVEIPPGIDVPVNFRPAVIDAGDLGRLLIVDTTDEKISVGSLSSGLGGKRALLVAGSRGRLITLPSGDPASHRLARKLTSELKPDRSMTIMRKSTYAGQFAANVRQGYDTSATERREVVERRVAGIWVDARVSDYTVQYETEAGEFVETVALKSHRAPGARGGDRIEIFPGAADDLERVPLAHRKLDVDYGHPLMIQYDASLKGLPAGVALPESHTVEGDGWSIVTHYAIEAEVLNASWEARLSRTRFRLEDAAELRRFWTAVMTTANATITVP